MRHEQVQIPNVRDSLPKFCDLVKDVFNFGVSSVDLYSDVPALAPTVDLAHMYCGWKKYCSIINGYD